jgi:hypothetical protein
MDVLYGFVQSLDHFNGALEASVFRAQRFGRRRTERQVFAQRRTGENLHLHKGGDMENGQFKLCFHQQQTMSLPNTPTPSFLSMVQTSEKNVPELDVPLPPVLPSRSS